jgi:hypothetical protein
MVGRMRGLGSGIVEDYRHDGVIGLERRYFAVEPHLHPARA